MLLTGAADLGQRSGLTSRSVVTPAISTGRSVRSVIMPAAWCSCAAKP